MGPLAFSGSVLACALTALARSMLAMLELCSVEEFNCSRMVTCVSRGFASRELQGLLRDLAWAGFELCTLKEWTQTDGIISKKWIFTSTEV